MLPRPVANMVLRDVCLSEQRERGCAWKSRSKGKAADAGSKGVSRASGYGVWRLASGVRVRIERRKLQKIKMGSCSRRSGFCAGSPDCHGAGAVHFHSTPPNATRHDMNNCFLHAEYNSCIARFSRLRSFMSYKTFLQTAGRRGITRMPNPLYTFKNDFPFYCVYLAVSLTANENGLLPISGLRGSMGEAKSPSSLSSSSAAITSRC
jgi:hypothetical protein